MTVTVVSEGRMFDGVQGIYQHDAQATGATMRFAVYVPPQAAMASKPTSASQASPARLPVLFWLSGLSATEENFVLKAGAQRVAAELGLVLVVPDTSPRVTLPGDRDAYDFGVGAGFYLDATQPPWSGHYRMATWITAELPALVAARFPVDLARAGICGHSMGGHGALSLALKHPQRFRVASAFAPIASTMRCPWGTKALAGYLGDDRAAWQEHDVTALVRSRGWSGPPLLVDQGTADPFLAEQLKPELLEAACDDAGVALVLHRREGYDHSYFFIATFIESHLRYHAAHL